MFVAFIRVKTFVPTLHLPTIKHNVTKNMFGKVLEKYECLWLSEISRYAKMNGFTSRDTIA